MVLVIAHRGLSSSHPENTLSAFRAALDAGAHLVELDVQLSKDGHVVVMHDTTVNRTCKGQVGMVKSFTAKELTNMDAGSHKGEEFKGERVPLLKEVLDIFVDPKVNPNKSKVLIELKFLWFTLDQGLFAMYKDLDSKVAMLIKETKAHDVVVVQSFVDQYLHNIRQLDNRIELHLLVFPWRKTESLLKVECADSFNPNVRYLSKSFVQRMQKKGKKVLTWTVDSDDDAAHALHCGVDGVITNVPGKMLTISETFDPAKHKPRKTRKLIDDLYKFFVPVAVLLLALLVLILRK